MNVLLISDGFIHPPLTGRINLRKCLAGIEGIQIHKLRSIEKLPVNLKDFSAVVIYIHCETISDQAVAVLDSYLLNGGGVLAIHSATASGKNTDQFTNLLGGKFIEHGPVGPFKVMPAVPESEIFQGIPAFQVIDELYLHDLQPDIETHFTAQHKGEKVPMVWTRNHGSGRVCYACPGHRAGVFKDPAYSQVLIRGLEWAASVR